MSIAAFDIGARFGDLALWDGAHLHLSKHRLPEQSADAALDALGIGLAQAGQELSAVSELRLCQTWALNALLLRAAAPVTLITTRGFGDMITLARQDRADLYDPVARSAAPGFLIGRVIELDERIAADGAVICPPDLGSLTDIGSGTVAVCLLNAHQNGAHERAVAEALPGASVFLSHQVDPAPREYERAVATCLEAWLHGALAPVLAALKQGLAERGFVGRLLLADGTGMLGEDLALLEMLSAGPAVAAGAAAGLEFDGPVIGVDLGSRSLDLSLIRDGAVVSRNNSCPGGVPLRLLVADTYSVALGGQSCPLGDGISVDAALAALGRFGTGAEGDPDLARQTVAAMARQIGEQIIDFAVARNLDPYAVPLVLMGGLGALVAVDIANALGLACVHFAPATEQAGSLALLSAPEVRRRRLAVDQDLVSLTPERLQEARRDLRQLAPAGFNETWTAEIAPVAQAEPERVALDVAPETSEDLIAAWQVHMHFQTGVRPAQGVLRRLELAHLRGPTAVPLPEQMLKAPEGWRMRPDRGCLTLERVE